jgi:hypothetical protein
MPDAASVRISGLMPIRTTQPDTRIRLNEAHSMLVEAYDWFTEGFETADLQETKLLLNDLATNFSILRD